MLTFLPLDEINKMAEWEGAQLNEAKEILAHELTEMIHGKEEADKAQESAKQLFSSGNAADMPTYVIADDLVTDGEVGLLNLLTASGLTATNSDARRAIVNDGSISIDGEKVTDFKATVKLSDIPDDGIIIKKGKKHFRKILK